MEYSVEELFGEREAESVRGSGSEDEADNNEDDEDDGGQGNPLEEAVEVPEPGWSPSYIINFCSLFPSSYA